MDRFYCKGCEPKKLKKSYRFLIIGEIFEHIKILHRDNAKEQTIPNNQNQN